MIYAWYAPHTQELSTISRQDLNSLLSHFLLFLGNLLHGPESDRSGRVSAQRALQHLGQNMRMENSIVIKNNLTCGPHSEQMRCCPGQQNKGAAATLKQTGHSSFFFIHLIWSLRCSSRLPGSTFFSPEGEGGGGLVTSIRSLKNLFQFTCCQRSLHEQLRNLDAILHLCHLQGTLS